MPRITVMVGGLVLSDPASQASKVACRGHPQPGKVELYNYFSFAKIIKRLGGVHLAESLGELLRIASCLAETLTSFFHLRLSRATRGPTRRPASRRKKYFA
jgi:hypothetical protein